MRILLIFIALAVIVMVAKRLLLEKRSPGKRQLKQGNMVQCAKCGTYTPEADATKHGDQWYCNDHRQSGGQQD